MLTEEQVNRIKENAAIKTVLAKPFGTWVAVDLWYAHHALSSCIDRTGARILRCNEVDRMFGLADNSVAEWESLGSNTRISIQMERVIRHGCEHPETLNDSCLRT